MLRFDWDERKNKANRRKHGVWFEEAQSAFDDPSARLFDDPEHSDGEERLILLGVSAAARLPGCRPLLSRIRSRDPDYIREESNRKGGGIL